MCSELFVRETAPMMEFVSEPVTPEPGTFDAGAMSSGLASLPAAFTWRDRRYRIIEVLEHTKLTSVEGGTAQGERYLRRQRFMVRLDSGEVAVLDFHRQTAAKPGGRAARQRWFLFTIERATNRPTGN